MNPFLRYLADKKSAHRQTDRHTPMTTRVQDLAAYGAQVMKPTAILLADAWLVVDSVL